MCGRLTSISTLLSSERDELWELARTFDEVVKQPEPDPDPFKIKAPTGSSDFPDQGKRPGDDFTERVSWQDILEPHGWVEVFSRGDVTYWRRPGKDRGISATTGHCKGLKVFTTSTSFSNQGTYTKLGAYALLNRQGDFDAAVKDLAAQRFGTWIDNDGTEKQNPPPAGWKRRTNKASSKAAGVDWSWVDTDFATLADAETALGNDNYVWNLWIVHGAVTAVVADPGIGKTRVAAEWCKRLWFGEPMPDGSPNHFSAETKTLWLLYDRNWRGLVRAFKQFGVPREAILLPTRKNKPRWLPDFDKPETMDLLREFIVRHKPGLLVIDTTTYASIYNTGKPNEAKLAYDPLMDLVMETSIGALGLTHTNKEGGVLNRRFLERCRIQIMLSKPDPNQPNKLRVEVEKTDDIKPPALGATFTDSGVTYDQDAPVAAEGAARGRKPSTSPGLAQFLLEYLGTAPLRSWRS